jgi:cation:H+ antiporter
VNVLLIIFGLIILTYAADKLVEGAASMARRLGVSPLVVGLTVVAYGTSFPELVVSVQASFENNPGITVGNAVGSTIFNSGLILGLAALICPIPCNSDVVRRDVPVMIGSSLLIWFMARDQQFSRPEGIILILLVIIYSFASYYLAKKSPDPEIPSEALGEIQSTPARDIFRIVVGMAGLIGGAKLLLIGSVAIAKSFGISDEIIGLTLVAAGTSMPELATSVVAAWRGQPDIAIGNVVGSNIFNILGIIGVSGVLLPLQVSTHMLEIDIPIMVIFCLGALPIMKSDLKISRLEGFFLTVFFLMYNVALYFSPS